MHGLTKEFFFHWMMLILRAQTILIGGLVCFTFCLLIFRQWREKRMLKLREEYHGILIDELMLNAEEKPYALLKKNPAWMSLRRKALKEVFLSQMRTLVGPEHAFFVQRYCELGLERADLKLCNSWMWWRRLRGVSNLSALKYDRLGSIFRKLSTDKNELVALYSVLALSGLWHPENNFRLFKLLPKLVSGRKNILVEIVTNLIKVHGYQDFREMTEQDTEPLSREVYELMITALCSMRIPEAGDELSRWLERGAAASPILIADAINTLREIGDPTHLESVEKYITHDNIHVRQKSLEYIVAMGAEDIVDLMGIEHDKSAGIQRILSLSKRRGVA